MPVRFDAGSDELARDQLRLILDRWSPFARVSRRLLADLVERSMGGVSAAERSKLLSRAGRRAPARARAAAADRPDSPAELEQPAWAALLHASRATPELAWSLEAHRLHQTETQKYLRDQINQMCRPELVWCDTDFRSREHLEPLVHLLAYVIARDLDESTAVVVIGPGAERRAVLVWNRERPDTYPLKDVDLPGKQPLTAEDLYSLVRIRKRRRSHVFVIDLDPANRSSTTLDRTLKFDRIIHLTDRVSNTVPEHLRDLLDDRLFVEGDDIPYYCAFIASVVVARDIRQRTRQNPTFEARRVRSARRREQKEPYPYISRIERDACVVPVDLERLAKSWADWNVHRSIPFLDVITDSCMSRESVARWGRAVTNRRIGVAVSGGGACAYRAGALLECMERANLPVDVFAGLSGGALVGAFYCHSGLAGFARLVALGPFIQLTTPLALTTTWPLEGVVDAMLGGTRVEDLEVRFAAVAVALPPDDLPMTEVVVNGTIGEAVRVSGTLPPAFAQTIKGGMRFTDGGAGSAVPAQVARDFGADIVIACNAIPGPSQSNPLPKWLRLATTLTAPWLQRQIDYYAWHSYFWRQVSQRFLREADVAFEFKPEQISLLEAGQWILSSTILERARRDTANLEQAVRDLKGKWKEIGDRYWLRYAGEAPPPPSRPPSNGRTRRSKKP